MSVFVPILHHFDYCHLQSDIWEGYAFCATILTTFLKSFLFHCNWIANFTINYFTILRSVFSGFFKLCSGTFLEVQWLRFHASTVGNMSLIPSQGTKMAQASLHGQILVITYVVVLSLSRIWLFATPWTGACQVPLSPRVSSNSCPFSCWCCLTISSSATPYPFCIFCSVARSCLTPCDPMECSTPGFPVLHHLLELAQTQVHWVTDAIQPSHPVIPFSCLQSFPASGSFLMSQVFASGGQSIGALPSILPMNIQGWFPLGMD